MERSCRRFIWIGLIIPRVSQHAATRSEASQETEDLRDNLVLKPTQEQRRHLDVRDQAVTGPDLVAQIGKVLGWGHDGRDELAHAEEGVLEDEAGDVSGGLVLGDEADADGAAEALPVDDDLVVPRLGAVAEIVEGGLGVGVEAGLVGSAGRDAVAAVLEHEHVAARGGDQHAGDGQAVADVARVAVEHEDRHVGVGPVARAPDVEGRQLLAIVGRDDELLVVLEVKLAGPGDFGARVGRDGGGIDQCPEEEVVLGPALACRLSWKRKGSDSYFCLK